MPKKKSQSNTSVQQSRQTAEARIDKLLELVDAVARVDTKMEGFCKETVEELKELKNDLYNAKSNHSKIVTRIEQTEKALIKAQNERIEWKSEFDKWKWRLGEITPMVT